jgi:hypothetical protein
MHMHKQPAQNSQSQNQEYQLGDKKRQVRAPGAYQTDGSRDDREYQDHGRGRNGPGQFVAEQPAGLSPPPPRRRYQPQQRAA